MNAIWLTNIQHEVTLIYAEGLKIKQRYFPDSTIKIITLIHYAMYLTMVKIIYYISYVEKYLLE